MRTAIRATTSVVLMTTAMGAYAQGAPGGVAMWIVAGGGGFLAGLAAGLLWCWLRCRAKKELDRQDK